MDLFFMLLKHIIYICDKLGNILPHCNLIPLANLDCGRLFAVSRKKVQEENIDEIILQFIKNGIKGISYHWFKVRIFLVTSFQEKKKYSLTSVSQTPDTMDMSKWFESHDNYFPIMFFSPDNSNLIKIFWSFWVSWI